MEDLTTAEIAAGALLLIDSAPIIYVLAGHKKLAARFLPLFSRHAAGEVAFAVTTVTLAEVLTGPLMHREEALARRYRAALESWQIVELTAQIAEGAARMRAAHQLRLPDAIQAASALAISADALVTHDRDFSTVKGLRVLA